VLFYGSWQQTGLNAEKTFEIDIQELENTHEATSENTITGNFKLVLARYLHIYSKLNYQRKLEHTDIEQTTENTEATIPSTETTVLEYKNYPINNHRRMRSKVLHYIDHPLLGMLIQINPVKAQKKRPKNQKNNTRNRGFSPELNCIALHKTTGKRSHNNFL